MEPLLAFAAALVSLRLAAGLARRWRARRAPELAAWAASLVSYALASGALAWGAAAGWNDASFRVYYVCGALLTAPLLGAGSLLFAGRRWAAPLAFVYVGFAVGVGIAVELTSPVHETSIPGAQDHLAFLPARLLAILANSLGTLAVVTVVVLTFSRRPIGNAFILAGVASAAAGSAVAGLGVAETSLFIALGALLLYVGFLRRT
ncbi:MAG TPA: hypothetical protein VGQ84_03145 [Gaiellaceae bacterium]|nr:hypothetical protein [Gaiellaceae bacterium]